ncbi:MAG: T9SS type A sorting domain-containing protein [Candidatus Eisenbacteria bacterium]
MEAPTILGDYSLDAASPCLPENNPNGPFLIGALGQGCDVYTSVAEGGSMPSRAFGLFVSPNPTTGEVSLRYSLPSSSSVPVTIYDIRGRVVRALEGKDASGVLTWDGRTSSGIDAPAGVYFVRMEDGERTVTERVVVIR